MTTALTTNGLICGQAASLALTTNGLICNLLRLAVDLTDSKIRLSLSDTNVFLAELKVSAQISALLADVGPIVGTVSEVEQIVAKILAQETLAGLQMSTLEVDRILAAIREQDAYFGSVAEVIEETVSMTSVEMTVEVQCSEVDTFTATISDSMVIFADVEEC